jgi:hypothetical protein
VQQRKARPMMEKIPASCRIERLKNIVVDFSENNRKIFTVTYPKFSDTRFPCHEKI